MSLPGNTAGDDLTQTVFSGDGEIDRIGKRERRTIPAALPVAGGAVFFKERGEASTSSGRKTSGPGSWTAGNMIAAEGGKADRGEKECVAPVGFECGRPHCTSVILCRVDRCGGRRERRRGKA